MNKNLKFTKDNTINYILGYIPEYQICWDEHLKYWAGAIEKKTIGIDLMNFLSFTTEHIKNNNQSLLKRIFQIIEELNLYGNEEVQYAASLIFFEGLTNTSGHNPETIPFERYVPLLGPKSKEICKEIDKYWGTKTPGLWDDGNS